MSHRKCGVVRRAERRTFSEVLNADAVKLLDLLHYQLLLVDLDDECRAPCTASREAELAQGGLELLRDVDGVGLRVRVVLCTVPGIQIEVIRDAYHSYT